VNEEHVQQAEHAEEQQPEQDDRLLRLAADFENYKKRAARER
jgi:molecular chaperone GrpE (heat shock protein)